MRKESPLNSVSTINVTDRTLEEYDEQFGENELEEILPKNGLILNMGSGYKKQFEKEILKIRKDLQFISADISLSLITKINEWIVLECSNDQSYVQYVRNRFRQPEGSNESTSESSDNDPGPISDMNHRFMKFIIETLKLSRIDKRRMNDLSVFEAVEHWRKRFSSLNEIPGSLAMSATDFPLSANSIDAVIDICGPSFYLGTPKLKQEYLNEIHRVLKPSMSAYIYLRSGDEPEDLISEEKFKIDWDFPKGYYNVTRYVKKEPKNKTDC